ncbi:MAG: DUF2007 domain-containing protein [Spirochaetes bacterium]|nr:DUF2007 domain-containing protein [Spirochaetota bacterium]
MVKFLLDNNGIEAIIENDGMTPVFGMVPRVDPETSVLVRADRLHEAEALIEQSTSVDIYSVRMAKCARCGEMVCDLYDLCWNCRADMKTGEPYRGDQPKQNEAPPHTARFSAILYVMLIIALAGAIAFFLYRYLGSG